MKTQTVRFSIGNKSIEKKIELSKLRLGLELFVTKSILDNQYSISLTKKKGADSYWVKWITPSENHVKLEERFKIRDEFIQRVSDVVDPFATDKDIKEGLLKFEKDIRPEYQYKTKELDKNPLSVVFAVIERLDVISKLNGEMIREELFCYHEPLVSYLLLTCFDRLGQPSDWLDFGAWLKSTDHASERDKAIADISSSDCYAYSLALHNWYISKYGVKKSFDRFLKEIIPNIALTELLESISITKCSLSPNISELPIDDKLKLKYLYKRRNDYTHKAAFTPPAGEWLGSSYSNHVQEFHAEYWTDTETIGWSDVLEKTVRIGLANYIVKAKSDSA